MRLQLCLYGVPEVMVMSDVLAFRYALEEHVVGAAPNGLKNGKRAWIGFFRFEFDVFEHLIPPVDLIEEECLKRDLHPHVLSDTSPSNWRDYYSTTQAKHATGRIRTGTPSRALESEPSMTTNSITVANQRIMMP